MKKIFRCTAMFLMTVVCALQAIAAPAPKTPLIVAQDGSGDFTTIQEAIYAVRDYTPVPITIIIKPGTYHEKVVIPSWKCDITLKGSGADNTIITWGEAAGMPQVFYGQEIKKMGTFRTHTLLVGGNDITIEDLTIENSAGRIGQAVALHTEGTRIIVRRCRLLGNQDTVFTGNTESYVYFDDCYITGTTDYIFGPATCWFEKCQIHSLTNSFITAASTSKSRRFGYVFNECTISCDKEATQVYLGRPWRAYAAVVFMHCYLPEQIRVEGWQNWGNPDNEHTARYAEYECTGAGADRSGRVSWSRELTPNEASYYTRDNVLAGNWWQR